MQIPNSKNNIIVCLDETGIITTAQITYQNKEHIVSHIKQFNAHLSSNDNSIWSVDVKYPYIIVGGNHKGVLVFNYEEDVNGDDSDVVKRSVLYKGNEHNVPSVRVSSCGLFIASNSIDSYTKVFDVYKKKMLCKFNNPKSEWGWNVMFIPKCLFSYKEYFYDFVSNENENNFVTNLFHLENANLTNKNTIHTNAHSTYTINKDSNDYYYQRYLEDNLINKYYILSTYHNIAYLNELVFAPNNNNDESDWRIENKPLGKVELFKNFLIERFRGYTNLSFMEILILKQLKSFGRYEYLFISESMKLIFIGNKTGDLQIFRMVIEVGECDDKIGIIDTPDVIIDYYEKLAGIRVIESDDGESVDIYAIDLKGTFHQHRLIKKKVNNDKVNENEEDEDQDEDMNNNES